MSRQATSSVPPTYSTTGEAATNRSKEGTSTSTPVPIQVDSNPTPAESESRSDGSGEDIIGTRKLT